MLQKKLVEGLHLTKIEEFFCESCQFDKAHRFPFQETSMKRAVPGEYIHSNVCESMYVNQCLCHHSEERTFVIFKNNATG